MNGTLIPSLGVEPMDHQLYITMAANIHINLQKLQGVNKEQVFRIIPRAQKRHGDVLPHESVRVLCYELSADTIKTINDVFGVKASKSGKDNFFLNGASGTYSIKYKGHQVDFEPVPAFKFSSAYIYRCGENAGVLLDKLAKCLGMDFTETGLFVNIPKEISGDVEDTSLLLATSVYDIERALGISRGFLTAGETTLDYLLDSWRYSPYASREALGTWTAEEIALAPKLHQASIEYLDKGDQPAARYDLINRPSLSIKDSMPTKTLIRYILKFFSVEDRLRAKIKNQRVNANKNMIMKPESLSALLGVVLSTGEAMEFLTFYKNSKPGLNAWLSRNSYEEVKVDVNLRFKEFSDIRRALSTHVST